jgi:hypothetical protein
MRETYLPSGATVVDVVVVVVDKSVTRSGTNTAAVNKNEIHAPPERRRIHFANDDFCALDVSANLKDMSKESSLTIILFPQNLYWYSRLLSSFKDEPYESCAPIVPFPDFNPEASDAAAAALAVGEPPAWSIDS